MKKCGMRIAEVECSGVGAFPFTFRNSHSAFRNPHSPIRIGYVIGQLSFGGAERQLYELVRGIDRNRFQSFVYCLSENTVPFGERIKQSGAELRVLERHGHFDVARILKLAGMLRGDRIQILHSFLFLGNGYAWPARLLSGVPHLVTSARNCKDAGQLRTWVNRLAFQRSDAIVCNGEAVRSFAAEHYHAPREKTVVIYNGLNLSRFSVTPSSWPLPLRGGEGQDRGKDAPIFLSPTGGEDEGEGATERATTVITVGRLAPQKDLDLFLEAAAILFRKAPAARFVIVGEGPSRARLEKVASRNGLADRVFFLGERDDVPELLEKSDIFWLTSAWEGLPNVLLEAMACGIPVVARDVGACREVITHGVNGYLIPERDAERFSDHTLGLLADPRRLWEMGRAGRRTVEEKFSVGAMVQATEALYERLLEASDRRRKRSSVSFRDHA